MKITDALNNKIKNAVRSVRKPGECVEVYWQGNEPYDEKLHGEWSGDLRGITDLRKWITVNGCDNRIVTIYCDGDYQDVSLQIGK